VPVFEISFRMLPFKLIYSDDYYLPIGAHVFPAEKYRRIHERLLESGVATEADFIAPQVATDQDILLVHTPQYVEKLKTGTLTAREELQMEVPYSPELVRAFWLAAGGSYIVGANDSRCASPELIPVGRDTLTLLPRTGDDDFGLLAPGQAQDPKSTAALLKNEFKWIHTLGGLYALSYHSQLMSRPEHLPAQPAWHRLSGQRRDRWWRCRPPPPAAGDGLHLRRRRPGHPPGAARRSDRVPAAGLLPFPSRRAGADQTGRHSPGDGSVLRELRKAGS